MNRLLTDKQLGEAVTRGIINHQKGETGWQAIRNDQDINTLKAVGEWLANLTISGNAVANELRIVEGIEKLKHGEMPN